MVLITQRPLADGPLTQRPLADGPQSFRPRADGATPGLTEGIALREAKLALVLPVGSDGRRLGRGTSRGTGCSEIPVQSALWVPSGVLSVQVMPSVQESGPLVMRRWQVFD